MLEKNIHAKDCVEFVQYMHSFSFPNKDELSLERMYPLPELLRKRIGRKRIVVFSLGESAIKNVQANYAEYFRIRLDYLRESLAGLPDIFLWWYDDGQLSKLVQELHHASIKDEAEALNDAYKKEQLAFMEGESSWYDSSGEEKRALGWADAYVGDTPVWDSLFLSQGKASVFLDFASLFDGAGKLSLKEWLDNEVFSSDFAPMSEWKERIRGKVVVLYFLSAAALLHSGEKVVNKLVGLIKYAVQQEGIVIWWLYDKSIEDLLPCLPRELQQKYKETRKAFLQCGGLLDESGDVVRAVDRADVCYMDSAASAEMLNCVNKPLIFPVIAPLPNFYYFRLRFMAMHMDDKYIYFAPSADRGTFWGRMRIDDGSVDIRILYDEAGHGLMTKIMGAVSAQNKLLIYPLYGRKYDEFILSNLQDGTYEVIKTSRFLGGSCCPPPRSFRSLCKYRNRIFVATWSWPRIIILALDSKTVKCIDMQEAVKKAGLSFDGSTGLHLSCLLRGHYYVLYYDHDVIFDIDAEQEKLDSIRRFKGDLKVRLLETDGELLWLGTAGGQVIKYDVRTGGTYTFEQRMPLYKSEQYFCNGWMFYYEGALHFFSTYVSLKPECLYTKLEIKTGKFADIKVIEGVGWLNNIIWTAEGKLLISSKYKDTNKVFLLELSSMETKEWKIELSTGQERAIKQQILHDYRDMGMNVAQEDVDDITVKDVIDYCLTFKNEDEQKNTGKRVYDYIMGRP